MFKTKFQNLTRSPRMGTNKIRYKGTSSNGGLWSIVKFSDWYDAEPIDDLARSYGFRWVTGRTLADISKKLLEL